MHDIKLSRLEKAKLNTYHLNIPINFGIASKVHKKTRCRPSKGRGCIPDVII